MVHTGGGSRGVEWGMRHETRNTKQIRPETGITAEIETDGDRKSHVLMHACALSLFPGCIRCIHNSYKRLRIRRIETDGMGHGYRIRRHQSTILYYCVAFMVYKHAGTHSKLSDFEQQQHPESAPRAEYV